MGLAASAWAAAAAARPFVWGLTVTGMSASSIRPLRRESKTAPVGESSRPDSLQSPLGFWMSVTVYAIGFVSYWGSFPSGSMCSMMR